MRSAAADHAVTALSTYHLLVELIYDGRAGSIPELEPIEPIDVVLLVDALSQRTHQDHGSDVAAWCRWFVEFDEQATESQKTTIKMLKAWRDRDEGFVKPDRR